MPREKINWYQRRGASIGRIARELCVSEEAVRWRLTSGYKKAALLGRGWFAGGVDKQYEIPERQADLMAREVAAGMKWKNHPCGRRLPKSLG